jgi:galactose mutarotase-like enzyme
MNDALLVLDPSARTLRSDGLRAVFLPGRGMLGASLQHRGEELLGRVEDMASFEQSGRTCGIPLLHPWANRLSTMGYRAAGKEVLLGTLTSISHDDKGLPMHGVPWPRLAWQVMDEDDSTLNARLDWTTDELLAVFPFPHHVQMKIALRFDTLSVETTLRAHPSSAVPVSFGFQPYFRLPGLRRAEWQVHLPAMSRLLLDERSIPTGEEAPAPAFDAKLGDRAFDDGFALLDPHALFSIAGNGRRIAVEFVEGYGYAQVFAPRDKDYIAIEPMTAAANALVSGRRLRLVEPGGSFRATFRMNVQEMP